MPFSNAPENAHECQPVAVRGVHVRLNLEDETGEVRLFGLNVTDVALAGQGRRRVLQEALKERLNAEVGDGGTEEHRRQLTAAHLVEVESVARFVQQVDFLRQPLAEALCQHMLQRGSSMAMSVFCTIDLPWSPPVYSSTIFVSRW